MKRFVNEQGPVGFVYIKDPLDDRAVEGISFRCVFDGSGQLVCDGVAPQYRRYFETELNVQTWLERVTDVANEILPDIEAGDEDYEREFTGPAGEPVWLEIDGKRPVPCDDGEAGLIEPDPPREEKCNGTAGILRMLGIDGKPER